jgi:NADH dehydrogenase
VPDLINPGKFCPPNAQHALREGNHIGDNLARVLRSAEPTEYKHKNIGAVASLGMYKGVAQMFGRVKVRGFPAWVMHRSYHVLAMPTFNRKVRIAAGWTGSLLFRREVVALGSLHDPRAEFRAASVPPKTQPGQADAAPVKATDAATAPDMVTEPGQPVKKDASSWDK